MSESEKQTRKIIYIFSENKIFINKVKIEFAIYGIETYTLIEAVYEKQRGAVIVGIVTESEADFLNKIDNLHKQFPVPIMYIFVKQCKKSYFRDKKIKKGYYTVDADEYENQFLSHVKNFLSSVNY